MAANNNQERKKNRGSKKFSIICCCISVGVVILLFLSCCFVHKYFVCHLQTDEVFDTSHGLKFDEKLMAQIDSLDGNGNYQDTVALKQEVRQLKRLTKYVIDRESNYQMEIDLIIDKYSQWTGYWLSIIGCVLTLFTLLLALLNYRSNDDNTKKIDKAVEDCKCEMDGIKKRYDDFVHSIQRSVDDNAEKSKNAVEGCKKAIEKMGCEYDKLVHDMNLSVYQNKLSCISACLSSFPDAFSLTPNDERQRFIRMFLRMLNEEYSDFTYDFERLKNCLNCKREIGKKTDLRKEIGYVYLVWCDISIAVNHAMYDFTRPEQNMAFDGLKEVLSTVITDYHDRKINDENIVGTMHTVLDAINKLLGVL